ncbi:hypothetical protein Poly59_39620 [Rubripirellula reticaptiva]|uniref:Uncharacterized protein n=1 Tax=Rubripirellula reticaptiva TaxID=2528013 RepID=A0A5C6EKK6_9BACT|nr:hypothetical protein Poly59_39620 [Rubripirellula reticaptiva]
MPRCQSTVNLSIPKVNSQYDLVRWTFGARNLAVLASSVSIQRGGSWLASITDASEHRLSKFKQC